MPLDPPNWQPTIAQVASRLLARTVEPNGETAGTFNQETKPTDTQVETIIGQAVSLMRPRLGEVPDRLNDQANALCTLRAAYMVETSFFLEQVETSMSPAKSLYAEYCEELKNWDMAAKGEEPNSNTLIHSVRVATEYPGYTTGTL